MSERPVEDQWRKVTILATSGWAIAPWIEGCHLLAPLGSIVQYQGTRYLITGAPEIEVDEKELQIFVSLPAEPLA